MLYSGTDRAPALASHLRLALLEPPLDLLARLPWSLRLRDVGHGRLADLGVRAMPVFVKPADPFDKVFEAGSYASERDIPTRRPLDPGTRILVAEKVAWAAEYRCFVREQTVVAWSPYLSFGRPSWKPHERSTRPFRTPENVSIVCERLFRLVGKRLPPAFVVDVGLIEDRGWAVVEFNPAFCSGLLGVDPSGALDVLERASVIRHRLSDADRRWVVAR